jgi:hypothetical protein
MPLGPDSSFEQVRADLARAHAAVFGTREDDALAAQIDGTANSLAIIAQRSLGAFDAEPDFITGSSAKEPTV